MEDCRKPKWPLILWLIECGDSERRGLRTEAVMQRRGREDRTIRMTWVGRRRSVGGTGLVVERRAWSCVATHSSKSLSLEGRSEGSSGKVSGIAFYRRARGLNVEAKVHGASLAHAFLVQMEHPSKTNVLRICDSHIEYNMKMIVP